MPLSEGATRARHARRLLQRVLDFAPHGTTIHPIVRIGRHAAEGIIEASAEQEADLIIFGWGGKAPAGREGGSVISPTIDEVVRDAPADIARPRAERNEMDTEGCEIVTFGRAPSRVRRRLVARFPHTKITRSGSLAICPRVPIEPRWP